MHSLNALGMVSDRKLNLRPHGRYREAVKHQKMLESAFSITPTFFQIVQLSNVDGESSDLTLARLPRGDWVATY
jgi:hypothetical protein